MPGSATALESGLREGRDPRLFVAVSPAPPRPGLSTRSPDTRSCALRRGCGAGAVGLSVDLGASRRDRAPAGPHGNWPGKCLCSVSPPAQQRREGFEPRNGIAHGKSQCSLGQWGGALGRAVTLHARGSCGAPHLRLGDPESRFAGTVPAPMSTVPSSLSEALGRMLSSFTYGTLHACGSMTHPSVVLRAHAFPSSCGGWKSPPAQRSPLGSSPPSRSFPRAQHSPRFPSASLHLLEPWAFIF